MTSSVMNLNFFQKTRSVMHHDGPKKNRIRVNIWQKSFWDLFDCSLSQSKSNQSKFELKESIWNSTNWWWKKIRIVDICWIMNKSVWTKNIWLSKSKISKKIIFFSCINYRLWIITYDQLFFEFLLNSLETDIFKQISLKDNEVSLFFRI